MVKAKAKVVEEDVIKAGSSVIFVQFTGEEPPDNGELLEVGEVYTVASVNEAVGEEEESYNVEVENPNFDSKKRESKSNPRMLLVDLFGDEVELTFAAQEEPEEEEEEEEEEVAAPTPRKAKAKAKAATKAKAAPKAKAKAAPKAKAKAAPKAKAAAKGKGPAKSKLKETDGDSVANAPQDMYVLGVGEEDEEVLAMVNESEDLCELAHEMCEEASSIDYRLGGVLYHVRLTGAFKELDEAYAGKKGFDKYCEAELGIRYRKAMHLIEIYTAFNRYHISGEKVSELGWTKCMEIARVMTDENAEELVELAETSSVSELKDSISESYAVKGTDTREKVKRISFKFRLIEDSGETVKGYLQQAMEHLGVDDEDAAFEHIVTEWAQDHLNIKKRSTSKKKAA